MKQFVLAIALVCAALPLPAQVLNIHSGNITVAVPATEAGDMDYASGTSLNVMGRTYNVAQIDSITITDGTVTPATVGVVYTGTSARVVVSGDIAAQLTIGVTGADVSIVAAPALTEEVNYVLSGNTADGTFYMDGEYKATLTLNNLTLTNKRGGAITIDNGKRIAVVLPEGTATTLVDGAGGTQKACFFVNGHPEFEGGGQLVLTGNKKHAFASDEYTLLKKSFGTLTVKGAVGDGMHVEQYFQMNGGTVNISRTKGDGIDASITKDAADELNGQVLIQGGSITLDVSADDVKGIKSDSLITISGGTISATVSGNGSKGISAGTDLLINQASGNATSLVMTVTGTTYMPDDPELEAKCRGIKVKGNFTFDGGNISISATGNKAKAISVDGNYNYVSGSIDCRVDAANT